MIGGGHMLVLLTLGAMAIVGVFLWAILRKGNR